MVSTHETTVVQVGPPGSEQSQVWLLTSLGTNGQVIGRVCDDSPDHDKIVFFDRKMTVPVPVGAYVLALRTVQKANYSIAVVMPLTLVRMETRQVIHTNVYPVFETETLEQAQCELNDQVQKLIREDESYVKKVNRSVVTDQPSSWLSNLAKSIFG